jgi:hypothetical protein
MGKSEESYLEDLARRIEEAARAPKISKAKLFSIADSIRLYKDKKYAGDIDLDAERMLRGEVPIDAIFNSLTREAEFELGLEPGELEGTF